MRFDKLIKAAGVEATYFEDDNNQFWVNYYGVWLRVPKTHATLVNCVKKVPDYIQSIIDREGKTYSCNLHDARLPHPDAKASELKRIYRALSDDTVEVSIDNKVFGWIERKDGPVIFEPEDITEDYCLIVFDIPDGENEEVIAIIEEF